MMSWNNLNLQNSNSPLMEQLIYFHDHSMLILILITNLVAYMMISLMINKKKNFYLMSGQTIEIIWTILPMIILIFIAFPSLKLLYLLEETNKNYLTVKTTGHQWYWKYEYSNFNIQFESFMNKEIKKENFRILETDNRIILPYKYSMKFLISAADVLHSWTIPSLGIKIDANPNRLNQLNFLINHSSMLYGQCSEICGANHSFMPISIESINLNYFIKWMTNNK